MKKITLGLMMSLSSLTYAQNGLEEIIVEKYYISTAADTAANSTDGKLPVNSVTYRIYADMLPGYNFQAAYGLSGHELSIKTTTLFFNNEDRGAVNPTYTKTQAKSNTVMLDSWLSVGAACAGQLGVLKTDDDGVSTVVNNDGLLQNNDPQVIGIPLTTQDGMVAGSPVTVTMVGITTESAVFDAQNDGTNGPEFKTSNGSWAALGGAVGLNPDTNRVLIAQITTDGVLSFELNIQIGVVGSGSGGQNYVAKDPVGAEIMIPSLTYTSTSSNKLIGMTSPSKTYMVYPNPAQDEFTVEFNAESTTGNNSYTVYSIIGDVLMHREIGKISVKQQEKVDLSNLATGLYIIKMNLDGVVSTKQVIKN